MVLQRLELFVLVYMLNFMSAPPGLLDYLLDSEVAANAQEAQLDRDWRFSVLRAILECQGAEEIVGDRVRYVAAEIERAKATDRPERYAATSLCPPFVVRIPS